MTHAQSARDSFVLFQIGDRRFAVAANLVAELSPPVRLHKFPHTTTLVSGVIVRRGKIVPVCDASAVVGARKSFANLFYLIAECNAAEPGELLAIPVNGESELVSGAMQLREDTAPGYISGTLAVGADSIAVLSIDVLAGALKATPPSSSEAHS